MPIAWYEALPKALWWEPTSVAVECDPRVLRQNHFRPSGELNAPDAIAAMAPASPQGEPGIPTSIESMASKPESALPRVLVF